MIIFLTLLYVGLLFVLLKIGVIKKFTPLLGGSVVIWFLLLNVILFIPMQFYAPAGEVRVMRYVIQIVPMVGGRVTEVPVEPNVPVKKGDVLFALDRTTYQAEVDRLEAQLADTQRQVVQLKEAAVAADAAVESAKQNIPLAESAVEAAKADITSAKAMVSEADAALAAANADVQSQQTQVELAQRRLARVQELRQSNAIAADELDEASRQVEIVEGKLQVTQKGQEQATEAVTVAKANLAKAEVGLTTAEQRLQQLSDSELKRAESAARQAHAAADADIEGDHPLVASVKAQMAKAQFDLDETIVRAPSDGVVVNLQLQPGSRVSAMPMGPVMTFISTSETMLAVEIPQNRLRHVAPGQHVEMALPMFPGQIIDAEVESIIQGNGQGQMSPSGQIPTVLGNAANRSGFAVRLKLPDDYDASALLTGAGGTAAIYTDEGQPTHMIRKVMLRMEGWLNYVF